MPIVIKDKEYVSGSFLALNQLSYLKANTGDRHSFSFRVESNIRISSVGNPILFDLTTNQLTSSAVSWLDEGFRDGDGVTLTKYDSSGNVLITWQTTVNFVTDTVIDVAQMQTGGYSIANGEIFVVLVNNRRRDDLDLLLNQVENGTPGSAASLIDGEITRATFAGLGSLAIGGFQAGLLVGNQSGNYIISAGIVREADTGQPGTNQYRITIDFILQGIHDQTPFTLGGALKFYVKLEWASVGGEPYDRAEVVISDDADTGWFNEPYNTGTIDSQLLQGADEISYCEPTTFDVIVDGPTSPLGVGGGVAILDETTWKNLPTNAQTNAIMSSTVDINAITTFYAFGANGEQLEFTINSINTVGTETTINITLTPNAQFTQFMENRDDGDRLFYLWVRCGSINHLAYSDQLICEPQPAGPLEFDETTVYLDHGLNVTQSAPFTDRVFDIEDDAAFYGKFRLTKNIIYSAFNVIVEAYNSTTGDDFTLQQIGFNFSSVQISNDGRYLLNESQAVITTLPTNSAKLNALLKLTGDEFAPDEYGVEIYYPFLLRWEYWLQQQNANVDFYPDQNKNWFPYDNTGSWEVRLRFQLVDDNNLANEHTESITIRDYDSEDLIDTEIELYVDATNQNVGIVTEGQLMRVVGTHTLTNGSWFDTSNIWGMITVEPTESAPRFICSSVLPFDGNGNNPLTPLDNVQMIITYPAPNIARMECYFNPDKINLENGCKFTSKIKGCLTDQQIVKTMTDGTTKTTTTGDDKTLAI